MVIFPEVEVRARPAARHDRAELLRSRDFLNHRWARVILRDLSRRVVAPPGLVDKPQAILAVRAVIAMADELLRETYVHANPRLAALAENEDDVAEVLTTLWFRALYGTDPEEARRILSAGIPDQATRGATASRAPV